MSLSDSDDGEFRVGEDLVPAADIKQAGTSVLDFDGLLENPIQLHEDLKEGCGGQLWPAGVALVKYLLHEQRRDAWIGKQIVELGAGGGLVGLALASSIREDIQNTHIYVTDQPQLLSLMQHNIILNKLPSDLVTAAVLDWSQPPPAGIPQSPDVILAADCVYFEPSFPLLIETMKRQMGHETVCFFCQKKRRKADGRFMKRLRQDFAVEEVKGEDKEMQEWRTEGLFMFKVMKKRIGRSS